MILLASGNYLSSMLELISVLLIFVFVLALTYFVTRWIAGYQRTKTAQGNLSVIEVIRVANNLSEEELRELPEAGSFAAKSGESFSDLLEAVKKKLPKR